jgi:hypothetical protein
MTRTKPGAGNGTPFPGLLAWQVQVLRAVGFNSSSMRTIGEMLEVTRAARARK